MKNRILFLLLLIFNGSINSCGNGDPDRAPIVTDDEPQFVVDPDLLGEWVLLSHEDTENGETITTPENESTIRINFGANQLEGVTQDGTFLINPYETRALDFIVFENFEGTGVMSEWDMLFFNALESQFFEEDGEYRLPYSVDGNNLIISYGDNRVMNLERL